MRLYLFLAGVTAFAAPWADRPASAEANSDSGGWAAFCERRNLDPEGLEATRRIPPVTFPVGIWFDGRVEGVNVPEGSVNVPAGNRLARDYYRRTFRDIKRHNLDLIVIPNTPPDYRTRLLDEAERVGVNVVLEIVEFVDAVRDPAFDLEDWAKTYDLVRRVHGRVGSSPALLAYQLVDEPGPEAAKRLRALTRVLGAVDPTRPAFSCLCAIDDKEGLIREWDPAMVVYDRYPLGDRTPEGAFGSFASGVDTAHRFAGERPLWMVVQACAHAVGGLRAPTPNEIRAMTWLSLAHGARGIFFFLYNSNTQSEHLIGLDQLPDQFAEVSSLAVVLKRLAPVLLTLRRVGPVQGLPSAWDAAVFRDAEGRYHAMVVNTDVNNSVSGALVVELPDPAVVQDCLTGESFTVEAGAVRLDLPPGAGKLLRY